MLGAFSKVKKAIKEKQTLYDSADANIKVTYKEHAMQLSEAVEGKKGSRFCFTDVLNNEMRMSLAFLHNSINLLNMLCLYC